MRVLIVGNGKMSRLFSVGLKESGHESLPLVDKEHITDGHNTVALHVGSGRQLSELVTICEHHRIPILNGSTGIQDKLRSILTVPVINAENFDLSILRLLGVLPEFAKMLNTPDLGFDISIMESHQATKKTCPGTAARIAAAVGVATDAIVSVRDTRIQSALGIPPESLSAHGYHWVTWIGGGGTLIQLSTKVNGRSAYLKGGIYLLQKLNERGGDMPNGFVDVIKFLRW